MFRDINLFGLAMKKILLSSAALLALSAGALAADLPSRWAAPPAFVAAPAFTWTGFYVGGNIGYGWRSDPESRTVFVERGAIVNAPGTTGTFTFPQRSESNGITGGGQVGYNVQFGSFVLGLEADIQAADLKARRAVQGAPVTFVGTSGLPTGLGITRDADQAVDWWGSARARAGFALDRLLVYGTGGLAFGGGRKANCNGFAAAGFTCNGDDSTRIGYAAGGGLEYAFTNNLTAGVEGLYVDLERSKDATGSFYDPVNHQLFLNIRNDTNDFGVVRAKVNWKF